MAWGLNNLTLTAGFTAYRLCAYALAAICSLPKRINSGSDLLGLHATCVELELVDPPSILTSQHREPWVPSIGAL